MDSNFAGEDTVTKTRRRYTLTKERGKWSTEEHNKFLEALQLYGRAWPRIREHVGTKTVVQIRSHAQKFFAKLQNNAPFRGISRVEAPDIDIPPPRRKRKLTANTYSPPPHPEIRDEKLLDLAKEQVHDKSTGEEQVRKANENHDQKQPETSFVSPMAALGNSSSVEGFWPWKKPSLESRNYGRKCNLRSSQDRRTHFIHAPPTFSNRIARVLLPKPASHAATSYAAPSWPAESAVCNQRCFCCMKSSSCPGSATIPTVAVAPATAQWPTHALVPLSVPCHAAAPCFGNTATTAREVGCYEKFRAKSSVIQNVHGAECLNHKHFPTISNQGHPAFQALYAREVYPMSFSLQQDAAPRETIGNNVQSRCHLRDQSSDKGGSQTGTENVQKGKVVLGIGQGKFNSDQTGFKPYERCLNPGIENVRKGKLVLGIGHGKINSDQTGFKPYKR